MFKYILFDLDGTLTDPKMGITQSVQYALKALGIDEPDLDKLEPFIGPPLDDSFKEFYQIPDEKMAFALEKYRERFSVKGKFENEVYPGIPEMLAALQKDGKKLAVASSKPTLFVDQIMEHFDLAKYFTVILGSEMDGTRKIKEEVVEETLRRLVPGWSESHPGTWKERTEAEHAAHKEMGIEYPDIAMVGDRKFDIQGAHAFHLVPVAVSYGYAQGNELVEEGADYIADTVAELQKILEA